MRSVLDQPMYWRARLDMFRDHITISLPDNPDLPLMRNGVMREKNKEENLVIGRLQEETYPNTPLTFIELCSFNNWFAIHPEKICGKEIITSSREFPLTIKGDRTWIENTINHSLGEDRLILPVPFGWKLHYFDPTDPDFDVEYTSGQFKARIYQGGIDYNVQITDGDIIIDNINHRELSSANLQVMHFMKAHPGITSSNTLELEALALELELQMKHL